MPQDNQDEKRPLATVGRTHRGEAAPPITTPEAVAAIQEKRAAHAAKPGAIPLHVYFVTKGIDNPIIQASMVAYTVVRDAPAEDFDKIFADHHDVPAPKPKPKAVAAEGGKP